MSSDVMQDHLPIFLRAYARPLKGRDRMSDPANGGRTPPKPSAHTLTFDCETSTDAAQQLRFGAYQVREGDMLMDQGLFYDYQLPDPDRRVLEQYAQERGWQIGTVDDFIEHVFFPTLYDRMGTCIGFNLPFDLSRLAYHHGSARGKMRGGFSFKLSPNKRRPSVQVKHLNSRSSLIRFTLPGKQQQGRSRRRRGDQVKPHRGFWVDVRTAAGAICGGSWTLNGLGTHLQIEHPKIETDEYDGPLTREFVEYAMRDVQATWECYRSLADRYAEFGLSQTQLHQIYSEASLGKARLREMGIKPWTQVQPDFPAELLGIIMSTYYGGRAEVHIRREIVRVLYCDFLSMYPTVCTLMGLWRFVISNGVNQHDVTEETRAVLECISVDDLQDPTIWATLTVLVQIQPNGDILPVRAPYAGDKQQTIGVNHLTSDRPQWFTLADVIAATILGHKTPEIIQAIRFEPDGVQPGIEVDAQVDFYLETINNRNQVKRERDAARARGDTEEGDRLDREQQALKTMANATSYGIFVELNVNRHDAVQDLMVYPGVGEPYTTRSHTVEEPGRYFHPLLATLITGAARLMLALAERLTEDEGITWTFCDTDSMALAKPDDMDEEQFVHCSLAVTEWFEPLNPYEEAGPLLQVEDANDRVEAGKTRKGELEPLYAFCIAAKRYALFNVDQHGMPVLRKASAHGLGHLLPPYKEEEAPTDIPAPVVELKALEVERWQHDLWWLIVRAAQGSTPEQVDLDRLPGLERPAVSRYAATKPALLAWLREYNQGKAYRDEVKPFNFLLAMTADRLTIRSEDGLQWTDMEAERDQVHQERWREVRESVLHEGGIRPTADFGSDVIPRSVLRRAGHAAEDMAPLFGYDDADAFVEHLQGACAADQQSRKPKRRERTTVPRPIAPYSKDLDAAAQRCFDRATGMPVAPGHLQTYRGSQALAQYHLHPEAKFHNANFCDAGVTSRRRVRAQGIRHIGKEADHWEEQFYLGLDPDALIEYGMDADTHVTVWNDIVEACHDFGVRRVAEAAGMTHGALCRLLQGGRPSPKTLAKLCQGVAKIEQDNAEVARVLQSVRDKCAETSIAAFAKQLGVHRTTLMAALDGKRRVSAAMLDRLRDVLNT